MRAELQPLLREFSAFERLSEPDLASLVEACRELHVRAGERVIEEGAVDGDVMLLLRGRLSVVKSGAPEPLAQLGPGAVVGLLAPVLGHPRSASVVATERSQIAVLRATSIELLSLSHAPVGLALQSAIVSQLLDDFVAQQRAYAERSG
ncbi:MAG: cyclic nucleotide-binding domain-containing protein [Deltaproteobacteria bacterium]|nr:cyclic nucleotide-binding domain-containing protein [Deltaproteobacteria bacterium]